MYLASNAIEKQPFCAYIKSDDDDHIAPVLIRCIIFIILPCLEPRPIHTCHTTSPSHCRPPRSDPFPYSTPDNPAWQQTAR